MRHRYLILALAVAWLGCPGSPPGPAKGGSGGAGTQRAQKEGDATYTLQTNFFGLIAYATEGNQLWAYLVNTDYKRMQPEKELLPPGLLDELPSDPDERANELDARFPHHVARITTGNAKIVQGQIPDPLPRGAEIRFVATPGSGPDVFLAGVSSATDVVSARQLAVGVQEEMHELDRLDPKLHPTDGSPLDDIRVTARVLVDKGTVRANPVLQAQGAPLRTFTFKTAAERLLGCPPVDPLLEQTLAEQVNVVDTQVHGQVTIEFGPKAPPVVLEPDDPTKPLVINVLNQVPHPTDAADAEGMDRHLEAYRWFYSLAANAPAPGFQYFPCEVNHGTLGGDKCPPRRFTLPKKVD